jgi:hypothetical protein
MARAHVTRVDVDPMWDRHAGDIRQAIAKQVGTEVAADARRHCPVDQGELLGSIGSEQVLGRDNASPDSDGWRVTVGTQYWDMPEYGGWYGAHVEGPYPPTVRVTDEHSSMDAEPYMRPALYVPRTLHEVRI